MIADLLDKLLNKLDRLFDNSTTKGEDEIKSDPPLPPTPVLALLRQAISEASSNFLMENSVLFEDGEAYNKFFLKKITLVVTPKNQQFVQHIQRLPTDVARNFAITAINATAQHQHLDLSEFFGISLGRSEDALGSLSADNADSEQLIQILAYDQHCQLTDLEFVFKGSFRVSTPPAKQAPTQVIHLPDSEAPPHSANTQITKLKPTQQLFSQETKIGRPKETATHGWLLITDHQGQQEKVAIDRLPFTVGRGLTNEKFEIAHGHDIGQHPCVSRRHLCITERAGNGELSVIDLAYAANKTYRKKSRTPMPERYIWQDNDELILGGDTLNEDTIQIKYQAN